MNKPMETSEFIKYVKSQEDKFIAYCEILINPEGKIILATPSHTEALVAEILNIEGCSRDELSDMIPEDCDVMSYLCDKYNYSAVWYNHVLTPLHVTDEQVSTINMLQKLNINSPRGVTIALAEEYAMYIWRNKMFKR